MDTQWAWGRRRSPPLKTPPHNSSGVRRTQVFLCWHQKRLEYKAQEWSLDMNVFSSCILWPPREWYNHWRKFVNEEMNLKSKLIKQVHPLNSWGLLILLKWRHPANNCPPLFGVRGLWLLNCTLCWKSGYGSHYYPDQWESFNRTLFPSTPLLPHWIPFSAGKICPLIPSVCRCTWARFIINNEGNKRLCRLLGTGIVP